MPVHCNFVKVKTYCGSRIHNDFDKNSRSIYRGDFKNIRVHSTGNKFYEYYDFDFVEIYFIKPLQYSSG